MRVISHRGYWKRVEEKNTITAFERSFRLGFGTETDLRDLDGEVVISHDMPTKKDSLLSFDDFLSIFVAYDRNLPLALNIKSDGLQEKVKASLTKYQIENYFLFDMALPDMLVSINSELTCFTRQSEYEKEPALYKGALGVWMDEFSENWITEAQIETHINNRKKVYIVSPELHKREHLSRWQDYRLYNSEITEHCYLCSDLPEEALAFFR